MSGGTNLAVALKDLPPALGADIRRVDERGFPTEWSLDQEFKQAYWFKTNVVALDKKVTEVKSQTDDNTASITSVITAYTDADSALASRIDTVEVNVGENEASIVQEATARADGDEALASLITTVSAEVDDNTAAISTEATARVNGDTANANLISAVNAKFGVNQASAGIYFGALAAPSGATAAVGLYAAANNSYAGLSLLTKNDGTSAIVLDASQFAFNDGGLGINVFTYSGGVATFNVPVVIRNQDIAAGAVSALAATAVTGTGGASLTMTNRSANVLISVSVSNTSSTAAISNVNGSITNVAFPVVIDGTVVGYLQTMYGLIILNFAGGGQYNATHAIIPSSTTLSASVAAGSRTYALQNPTGLPMTFSLVVTELSK